MRIHTPFSPLSQVHTPGRGSNQAFCLNPTVIFNDTSGWRHVPKTAGSKHSASHPSSSNTRGHSHTCVRTRPPSPFLCSVNESGLGDLHPCNYLGLITLFSPHVHTHLHTEEDTWSLSGPQACGISSILGVLVWHLSVCMQVHCFHKSVSASVCVLAPGRSLTFL